MSVLAGGGGVAAAAAAETLSESCERCPVSAWAAAATGRPQSAGSVSSRKSKRLDQALCLNRARRMRFKYGTHYDRDPNEIRYMSALWAKVTLVIGVSYTFYTWILIKRGVSKGIFYPGFKHLRHW